LIAAIALAYVVTGRLGLAISNPGDFVTLIWPPTGIALAAMLRLGLGTWPGVAIGSLLVSQSVGTPLWISLLIAAGNTAGPLLGTLLLRRLGFHPALDRRRDLLLFVTVGVAASMLFNASSGTLWLTVGGLVPAADFLRVARIWWLGDAIGALMVGIPLLTFSRDAVTRTVSGRRWVGNFSLMAVLLWSAFRCFEGDSGDEALTPWLFVPHLVLCWLAARESIFVAACCALLLAAIAAIGTTQGHGVFASADLTESVSLVWGYLLSLSAITLLVTGLTGELAANEERWQLALDGSNIGVGDWNLSSGRVDYSARWLALLGYEADEFGHGIDAWTSRVHPDDAPQLLAMLDGLPQPGSTRFLLDYRLRCSDGSYKWFEGHGLVARRSASGVALRVIIAATDITERRTAEERQRLSASLFQHLHEGLLVTDAEHRVLDVNPTFTDITGWSRDEMLGLVPALLRAAVPGSKAAAAQAEMWSSVQTSGTWRGEVTERRRSGEPCVLQVTISSVRGPEGDVHYHVLVISDITEAQLQRERLERQAHFDELTQLPNRLRLATLLSQAMADADREGHLLTVCYLDLDHFKPVNDHYGHAEGDRLLVELADRLRGSMRNWPSGADVSARLGGDEFVLLLRARTMEESRLAVERVLRLISLPYALADGEPVPVTASIGATVYPLDPSDADTLLRHADHAMYGAKQTGRNGYLFFDPEHDRRTEERFEALSRVQDALEAGQFRLFFQPKVDLSAGVVLGVEALLRWQHPEQGLIQPAQFLPLIEHTGLSERVGDWVLRQGIAQLAEWQRAGLDISVSVNVSARHLQDPGFAHRLASLLAEHSSSVARALELEVLETAALVDIRYTSNLMEQCKTLGVRFALDDFGTGYSTLTYLKQLPVDVLKIDRSFVHNMLHDAQDLAIVQGVIGLSGTFGCTVVAEGVESREQAALLMSIGCHIGQGLGIAAPMPAAEVPEWVRRYCGTIEPMAALDAA
jgi:diguanylate cyclase (GGDEF)-like protein/PAS domain S-box-containing protein